MKKNSIDYNPIVSGILWVALIFGGFRSIMQALNIMVWEKSWGIAILALAVIGIISLALIIAKKKIGFVLFFISSLALGIVLDRYSNGRGENAFLGLIKIVVLIGILQIRNKKYSAWRVLFGNVPQENEPEDVDNTGVSEIVADTEQVETCEEIAEEKSEIIEQGNVENTSSLFENKYDDEKVVEQVLSEQPVPEEQEPVEETIVEVETKEETEDVCSDENVAPVQKSNRSFKKWIVGILSIIGIAVVAGVIVYFLKNRKTDEERYKEAKEMLVQGKYEKGIEELEKIQETYLPAKVSLGTIYLGRNIFVGKKFINLNRGEELLRSACNQNDKDACFYLYSHYRDSGFLDSLEIYGKKLLTLGHPRANRIMMAIYYNDEIYGKKNKYKNDKSAEYYALRIADNNAEACDVLAHLYCDGGDGIEQNYNKAFYWWSKGAKLGDTSHAMCYSNLGWLYLNGNGVKQNYKKAFESFKKAINIDKEDEYSNYQLAQMFKYGEYVKANRDSARYYLQKAAEYGNEDAAVELENEFN